MEDYFKPFITTYITLPLSIIFVRFISTNPNFYTSIGAILGVMGFILVYSDLVYLGAFIFLCSGLFDILDGAIARELGKTSNFGSVLDIMSDRLVEFLMILGIFINSPNNSALLCLGMLGSVLLCVTSFLVVGIFSENNSEKSFHYSRGLIERPEAFLFFIMMLVMPNTITYLAPVFILLVSLTAVLHILQFKRQIQLS